MTDWMKKIEKEAEEYGALKWLAIKLMGKGALIAEEELRKEHQRRIDRLTDAYAPKITRKLHPAGEKDVESIWQERFNHPCVGGLFTISTDPDGCKTCGMSRLKYESLLDEAREKEEEFYGDWHKRRGV